MADKLCDEWNVDEEEFRSVRADEVYERARQILQKGALPAWPLSVQGETLESERLRAWRRISDSITTSCFDHLLSFLPQEKSVRLNVQRRMVPEIATLVSKPVYGGDYENPKTSQIAPLITQSFRHPWVFLNTKGYCKIRHKGFRESSDGKTGFINEGEARAALVALKQHLLDSRRHGKKINGFMVITFYLSQADLIESLLLKDRDLRRERKNIAILPIDRCQGQEADVVIVSFVRTTLYPRPNAGRWLQDARRLNVAFTRARRSLILIGNLDTLTRLRGNADGERILAHLDHCIEKHRDHQLEQLYGL
jgi:superfamily I DNA and/or RNA helicase